MTRDQEIDYLSDQKKIYEQKCIWLKAEYLSNRSMVKNVEKRLKLLDSQLDVNLFHVEHEEE